MSDAHVVKNCGKLELREDGSLAFEHWSIEGGGENVFENIVDAIINLLQEKRAEIAQTPYLEVPLN